MRRLLLYIVKNLKLFLSLLLALWLCLPAYPLAAGNKIRTIVIDPGHGGKDPGALGSMSKEKDIVLAIGLKLGKYIEENFPDVKVLYTRQTDVFPALHERAGLANKNKADLFISIHVNANIKPEIDGTETYCMGLHKSESNLEVAKLENSVILLEEDYSSRYEGFDPKSSESYIIFELIQSVYMEQSLVFANNVQDQFRERAQRKDRGVKQAGFLVLWQTSMPSVLIEAGYITNKEEEKFLVSDAGQDYLASAIFRAFRDYKSKVENHSVDTEQVIANASASSDTNSILLPVPVEDTQPMTNASGILFRVQLTSSQQVIPPDSKYFKGIGQISKLRSGDVYKYVTGEFTSYEDCKQRCSEVQGVFPGAFVIATQGEEIIPLKKALKKP